MGFFDNLFKKHEPEVSKQEFKHNVYGVEISQYSSLPRYYFIQGECYDIDSPKSVSSIPVCETHFSINEEDWGIDTVLREHVNRYYSHIPEELKSTCYPKISEFEWNGLKRESAQEKQARIRQETEQFEKEKKLRSISLKDMKQFHFDGYQLSEPIYDNNMCIITILNSDQLQVKRDMEFINTLVKESCAIAEIKPLLHIDVESLKFDIEKIEHTTINQYFTYFECNPYTKTGKLSKFPLILHYATESFNDVNASKNYFGDIYYLQDGSIGKCRLIYWNRRTMYLIDLGLIGKTLSTKKIEKTYTGDKAVIYKA